MSINLGARRAPPRRTTLRTLLASGALALAGCAAPAREPLDPGALDASLDARSADPAALAAALSAARIAPLALPMPALPAPDEAFDADRPEPWHASAFAWEARTRAARRDLLAARALAGAAGAPMPPRAMLEVEELEDPDARGRLVLTFDLLGILGLGPAAAARELADAEVRRSLGELEQAVWSARVEVDRARARLAAARGELAAMDQLAQAAAAARRRIGILHDHGRLSEQALAAADLAEHRLLHRLGALEIAQARARAELAIASGLPAGNPALDAVTSAALRALEPGEPAPQVPQRRVLLARSPQLRLRVVEHAVAEARVRQAAAERWPTLELGPHLAWMGDELLEGLAAGTAVPWPGSVEGVVAAALEERAAAREATEDALLALEARARAARERLDAAREMWLEHAAAAEVESARAWRAARALFDVEPMALMDWAQALQMRGEAIGALFGSRLDAVEAALDLALELGPEPLPELAEPRTAALEDAR